MASTPKVQAQEPAKVEAPLVNNSGYFDKLREQKQRKGFLSTFLAQNKATDALKQPAATVPSGNNTATRLSDYLGQSQDLNKQKAA